MPAIGCCREALKSMQSENTCAKQPGKTAAILGGGFAGLRIAYLLHKLKYNIILVEKTSNLGGMVQTYSHQFNGEEYRFDFGPHLFFEDYSRDYRELLGSDLLRLTGRFSMATGTTMLSYPLRPVEMLTKLGPLESAAVFADFVLHWLKSRMQEPDEGSLEAFMQRRFGSKLFKRFYSSYIEKCCGIPAHKVSALWAKERENVSGKGLGDNIKNKVKALFSERTRRQLTRANDPSAQAINAWYPRYGAGQVCEAMVSALQGQQIYCNATIVRIEHKDRSIQSVEINADACRRKIVADYYISTLPLPDLFAYLRPPIVEAEVAARQLRYRAVRLVNLLFATDRILDSLEVFSMDGASVFKRVYEPKAMSRDMAPAGKTSLCLEVCFDPGDTVSAMDQSRLVARCVQDLIKLKLINANTEVLDWFVIDLPHAYPIYAHGFEAYRQTLLDALMPFTNLLTCGRQGLFRYHAMTNEIMEMAESVTKFLEGSRDKTRADNKRSRWGPSFY